MSQSQLTGGIKNALERGESLGKIKQSFLNAGYSQKDIDSAASAFFQTGQTLQPITKTQTLQPIEKPYPQTNIPYTNLKQPPQQPQLKKKSRRWLVILAIFIILFVLMGAAIFGFFFDEIMQGLFG